MKKADKESIPASKRSREDISPERTDKAMAPATKKCMTDLSAFEATLDIKLEPLATQDDLKSLKKDSNSLKDTMAGILQENDALEKEVEQTKRANSESANKI